MFFFFLVIFLWISFGVFGAGWLGILFGIWRILWGIEGGGSYLDFFWHFISHFMILFGDSLGDWVGSYLEFFSI